VIRQDTRLSLRHVLLATAAAAPLLYGGDGNGGAPNGGAGEGEGGKGDSKDDLKSGSGGSGDPERKISALEEERDRHYTRRKDAERERDELKTWKEEQEAKGLGEVEKRDKTIVKHETTISKLQATIDRLAIENAFLATNDVKWHNPVRAMAALDLSDLKVGEDGKVNSEEIKKRIAKLAADEPYLVKSDGNDSDDKGKQGEKKVVKTGTAPANDGGKPAAPNLDALARKYPALRSRAAAAPRS
jgi:hypothetical protein